MPAAVDETIILEAALAVWREDGLRDATTRKVAERAGISEMTLFRRFGDKGKLFAAALGLEAARFQAEATDFSGDLRSDLVSIARAYDAVLLRNGAIVADFLLGTVRTAAFAEVAPVPMQAILRVASIIQWHQEEGNLRQGSSVGHLLSLLAPVVMQRFLQRAQPQLDLPVDLESLVDRFLDGARENP